jgi:D-serine deaminase-like pyridoxal phosphate-dependent protein
MDARTLDDLMTPAAVIDLPRMTANLDRMAAYASEHELRLRPHTKTHKTPELANEQIRRGAAGVTVATIHEAEVMSAVATDVLMAYPPVGRHKLDRLLALPDALRITVALDSMEALEGLALAAATAGRTIGVLVEVDLGMRRVGVADPAAALALARRAADATAIDYRGVLFYPGHIRQAVDEQDADLTSLTNDLGAVIATLTDDGLPPAVVSGGSTPTAFASHRVGGLTEMRPGTYIFNDRTTAEMGACDWDDCAYTVLATVVSTAVPGQAVVDAGSKALTREELRAAGTGLGAVLDHPEVIVRTMSEEHGVLDITRTDWRPRVGDRVRIVPNHVCVSVNMHNRLWAVEGEDIRATWRIAARNWAD